VRKNENETTRIEHEGGKNQNNNNDIKNNKKDLKNAEREITITIKIERNNEKKRSKHTRNDSRAKTPKRPRMLGRWEIR
jgi:hypothetical protein